MDDLIFNEQKEGQDQERPKGFANLINDVTFKKVFACKETMISFLNEIVKQPLVTDVTFLNTEAYAGTEDDRMAIFDIACRGQDGSEFIVEMQCAPQEYFRDRMLFYACYPILRQPRLLKDAYSQEHGNVCGFRWNYKLKPVMVIAITNFAIKHNSVWPRDKYLSSFHIVEDDMCEKMTDNLRFIFIELGRFSKTLGELRTLTDKWTYLFKNLKTMKERSEEFNEKDFDLLFDYANFAKFTAVELELYKTKEKMKYDYQNTLDYAEKKGRADGRSEEKLENARSLKERGVSLEIISEALGLPIETVREL